MISNDTSEAIFGFSKDKADILNVYWDCGGNVNAGITQVVEIWSPFFITSFLSGRAKEGVPLITSQIICKSSEIFSMNPLLHVKWFTEAIALKTLLE